MSPCLHASQRRTQTQHILWQLCKYLPFNCLNLFRRGLKIGDISTHDKQSGKDVNINCSHFRLSH